MPTFTYEFRLKPTSSRWLARNPLYAEAMASVRAISVEAVDDVQAEVRAQAFTEIINRASIR